MRLLCILGAGALTALGSQIALAQESPQTVPRGHCMMKMADKDGDGALSREELESAHKGRFEELDADGDGKLTVDEMRHHREARRGALHQCMMEQRAQMRGSPPGFGRADADGDGGVTLEEYTAVAAKRFEALDADKDGVISAEEWHHNQMRRFRGGRPHHR